MSEPGTVEPEKSVPAKKPISPVRNIVGLIVLAAVVVVGVIEYSAYFGHRWAAAALKARVENDEKDLMTMQEAETLLGNSGDAPAADDKGNPVWSFEEDVYVARSAQAIHVDCLLYEGKGTALNAVRDGRRQG